MSGCVCCISAASAGSRSLIVELAIFRGHLYYYYYAIIAIDCCMEGTCINNLIMYKCIENTHVNDSRIVCDMNI